MIVVAVTGGRHYNAPHTVFAELDAHHREDAFAVVIHGHCGSGLDFHANAWCLARGVQPAQCPALWTYFARQGRVKLAGHRRNWAMTMLRPRKLLAFPGNTGTQNMVDQCRKLGIEIVPCGGRAP